MLFMALFTVLVLHRVLSYSQLSGVALAALALCAVGHASVAGAAVAPPPGAAGSEEAAAEALVGVLLVMGAQVFHGIQFVWERKQLKSSQLPPLLLCGMEGAVGSAVMLLIVFPVLALLPGKDAGGCLESVCDTVVKISRSTTLQVLLSTYAVSVLTMNLCGMYCTKVFSGVHRTLVQNGLRTLCVWVSGLALSRWSNGKYGERWAGWASIVEVIGFVALLLGVLLYVGAVRLPESGPSAHTGYMTLPGLPPQVAVHMAPDLQHTVADPSPLRAVQYTRWTVHANSRVILP